MIRWSKQEIFDMRMFVLAWYRLYDTFAWKDVALFLKNRNSTQVRTHIQKFRDKLKKDSERIRKLVEDISTETRQDSRKSKNGSISHNITDKDKVFIEKLVKDYFEIVKSAEKSGVRYTDEQGVHTYVSLLKQFSNIPELIFSLQDSPVGEAYIKVKLNEILSEKSETISLLTCLQSTVETETAFSIIDYDRANTSISRPHPKRKSRHRNKPQPKKPKKQPSTPSESSINSSEAGDLLVNDPHCELYWDTMNTPEIKFVSECLSFRWAKECRWRKRRRGKRRAERRRSSSRSGRVRFNVVQCWFFWIVPIATMKRRLRARPTPKAEVNAP